MKHKLITLFLLTAFVAVSCNLPVNTPEATATPLFTETAALPSDTPAPTSTPPPTDTPLPTLTFTPSVPTVTTLDKPVN